MIGFSVTFEAAVSANEEEADFIPVSITRGFRWTSRTRGGSRVAVVRLRSWVSYPWQHCRGHIYKLNILCKLPLSLD